ncbi:MAG: TetR/AcrR family transcriptional regulator [Desulfomonile tiedjei]|uniref:TetR/AcrR family transcriptional regulator n=1 Tax=Desulfomonile tiedjei TaxID=2358 RepID=A0A9D6V533_9BACT|nr:TetR/AcrR family transcriptional regulator [Desulfomonile tiedjei]
MTNSDRNHTSSDSERHFPPGRTKIAEALKLLLEEKEFNAITTSEIAKTAGVTEALIYKYFRDKRDLLHQVLNEYVEYFLSRAETDLKGIKGALNKLRKLIWSHINMYATNRVFAKILVLEVRNYPDYFKSDAYETVKRYAQIVLGIIEEGVRNGEIRQDLSPDSIRQIILGGIEHLCLPSVIFNTEISPEDLTEELCELIFYGIATDKNRKNS